MSATLYVFEDGTSDAFRVWPDPEPFPPGTIQENRSYLFELRDFPEAVHAELFIDEMPLDALRSRDPRCARWRWSPGFHAGTVEAVLQMPGHGRRRFEIVTDADLKKLARDDFDAMVREILEDTLALFSLTPFRKGVARGAGNRPPPVARLEFLRSRIAEIEAAVRAIARNPRRILRSSETVLPCHRVRRATGPEIARSFRSGHVGLERRKPSRLPAPLRGHMPLAFRLRCRSDSMDIAEHRQLKGCLTSWAGWLARVADQLEAGPREGVQHNDGSTARLWKLRCIRMARTLSELATLPAFSEVGEGPTNLRMSQLWRHDPLYRRFFQLHRDMQLGIAGVFGDFLQMPLARTFDLYELWCLLRLVRAAAELYGRGTLNLKELFRPDGRGGLTIAANTVVVPLDDARRLFFRRQFREFWLEDEGQGSFSRTMTPDFVLQFTPDGSGLRPLVIFDAKYRVEDGLNAALSSIHTYRDALVRDNGSHKVEGVVRSAYLLTPHVPELASGYRDTVLPGRLFHPDYHSTFRFGAVTLRPGMTTTAVTAVLRAVIDDTAWETPRS